MLINPFHAIYLFLYPLKTFRKPEKRKKREKVKEPTNTLCVKLSEHFLVIGTLPDLKTSVDLVKLQCSQHEYFSARKKYRKAIYQTNSLDER